MGRDRIEAVQRGSEYGVLGALAAMDGALMAGPVTEIEEAVATCKAPGNGAGPFWACGAPMVVRVGDQVFTSVMETGEGAPLLLRHPLAIVPPRWEGLGGHPPPSGVSAPRALPAVTIGPARLLISVNPSTEPPGTNYGPCDPHPLAIDLHDPTEIEPDWPSDPIFTDHSHRGIGADGQRGEVLLLDIDSRTSAQHWTFRRGAAYGGFATVFRYPAARSSFYRRRKSFPGKSRGERI